MAGVTRALGAWRQLATGAPELLQHAAQHGSLLQQSARTLASVAAQQTQATPARNRREEDVIPAKPIFQPRKRPSTFQRPSQPLPPMLAFHTPNRSVIATAPGRLSVPKALGLEAAEALAYAHRDGVAAIPDASRAKKPHFVSSSSSGTSSSGTSDSESDSRLAASADSAAGSGAAAQQAPASPQTQDGAQAAASAATDVVPRKLQPMFQKRKTYLSSKRFKNAVRKWHLRSLRAYRATFPSTVGAASKFAIIYVGDKQYKVSVGDVINAEKLKNSPVGMKLFLDPCVVGSVTRTVIGRPRVQGASVVLTVESHEQDRKVIVFHKRRRKRYQRIHGHRREVTRLRVEEIICDFNKY